MEEVSTYDKWVSWRIQSHEEPMTRTQSLLAQEVLGNEKLVQMLSQPGDLQTIVQSIQKYLKTQ